MTAAPITGKKMALVILVEFTDVKFAKGNDKALYEQILNGKDFKNDMGFVGSVNDYFRAMSGGQFEFDFDIVGPEMLPNRASYYGKTEKGTNDYHVAEMVAQACQYVDEDFPEVNFADYDADGDGEVDLVVLIYAGQGENASNEANKGDLVWPHEGQLSGTFSTHEPITLDGVKIDKYACSCELNIDKKIDGIGVLCHEFAHTLNLHDMYDTGGNGNFGMSIWSLMDMGNYLGGGFIPAAMTAFERMSCGWKEPIVLSKDTTVNAMKALEDGGDTYIVYNDNDKNEFYLLENRQAVGWDAGLNHNGVNYGSGLLINHVIYNKEVWDSNRINANKQHCTILHADNSADKSSAADVAGDPYPYAGNNSATLANGKTITDITQNAGGTISFRFATSYGSGIDGVIADNINRSTSIYTLSGQYLGTDINALPKGIYVIGGKKVVK